MPDKGLIRVHDMDVVISMGSDPLSVREGLRQVLAQDPLRNLSADDRGTAEIVLAEGTIMAQSAVVTEDGVAYKGMVATEDGIAYESAVVTDEAAGYMAAVVTEDDAVVEQITPVVEDDEEVVAGEVEEKN